MNNNKKYRLLLPYITEQENKNENYDVGKNGNKITWYLKIDRQNADTDERTNERTNERRRRRRQRLWKNKYFLSLYKIKR